MQKKIKKHLQLVLLSFISACGTSPRQAELEGEVTLDPLSLSSVPAINCASVASYYNGQGVLNPWRVIACADSSGLSYPFPGVNAGDIQYTKPHKVTFRTTTGQGGETSIVKDLYPGFFSLPSWTKEFSIPQLLPYSTMGNNPGSSNMNFNAIRWSINQPDLGGVRHGVGLGQEVYGFYSYASAATVNTQSTYTYAEPKTYVALLQCLPESVEKSKKRRQELVSEMAATQQEIHALKISGETPWILSVLEEKQYQHTLLLHALNQAIESCGY